MFSNAENLVKIGPVTVVVEIFCGNADFCRLVRKKCSCYPHNLWGLLD